jgi:hypothetical protein
MPRLLEAGVTVLLIATWGVPVKATPETVNSPSAQSSIVQPTPQPATTQSPQPAIGARLVQPPLDPIVRDETPQVSERDRLILERRLQHLIPAQP